MKQIIKRGSFFTLMFMLLSCLSLYAADNDLITEQITIKLEKAGTLPDRIANSEMYKITNLKIIGEINGTDLKMIREMAGSNYTDGKLSVLDLSEAKIVEGGDYYYKDYNDYNDYYIATNSGNGTYSLYSYGGAPLTNTKFTYVYFIDKYIGVIDETATFMVYNQNGNVVSNTYDNISPSAVSLENGENGVSVYVNGVLRETLT